MANIYYGFITACLLIQHGCHSHSRELLPDYVHQVMERIVNPTYLSIFKLNQIKRLANERSEYDIKESNDNEYCQVLHGELSLEGAYLNRAYEISGKLVGYMTLFTVESDKCEKETFSLNKLTCYLRVGKNVANVYGLYEKSATHALKQMEAIDRYVTRLAEKCYQGITDMI